MTMGIFSISRTAIAIVCAIVLSGLPQQVMAAGAEDCKDTKIIVFGGMPAGRGGIPTPSDLAGYGDRATDLPVDGLIMNITNIGGFYSDMFYGEDGPDVHVPKLSYDVHMRPEVDIMRSLDLGNLKCNFTRMNIGNLRPDWFDDERWRVLLENVSLGARATQEMGITGILLDTEQYNISSAGMAAPFSYERLATSEDKFFEDYVAQVRQRGREFMKAINTSMPDVKIMFTFANSTILYPFSASSSPADAGDQSLFPAFLDGMMDVATPGTEFIDGFEHSYYYKTEAEFKRARQIIKYESARFSTDPERYIEKIRVGFGIFMHGGGRENSLTADIKQNSLTPEELANVLKWAAEYSDGYIWLYALPWFDMPGPVASLPDPYMEVLQSFQGGKTYETRPTYRFQAKRMNKSNATAGADPASKNWFLTGDYVALAVDPATGEPSSGTGTVAFRPTSDEFIADGNYMVTVDLVLTNIRRHPNDRTSDRNGSFSYRLSLRPGSTGKISYTHPVKGDFVTYFPQDPDNTGWPDYRGPAGLVDFIAYGAQSTIKDAKAYVILSGVKASDLVFELSDEVKASYGTVGLKTIQFVPAGYHHDSSY